jgi:replicative DNA helicase
VIGVCQADVTGENKKWLTMDNVANAKCLAPATKVLMYDGTWKRVENIEVGEQVMGVDSTPRQVLATAQGQEEMFAITHKIGGDTYVVNKSHILSLITGAGKYVNRPVTAYCASDFGYRVGHELAEQSLPIDPYFLGLWLGDGGKSKAEITTIDPEVVQAVKEECPKWNCSYTQYLEKGHIIHARMKYRQGVKHPFLNKLKDLDLFENKHIPRQYFKGSIKQRLALIAGLLDTDGTKVVRKHEYYVFSNANYLLALGLKELALSCGLMASFKQRGKYYYTSISGNDLSAIPCRIERKKSTYVGYKNVLKSRLEVHPLGVGDYAGIMIDGDHKFIIEGNIVTHNTSKQAEADWILGIGAVHDEGLKYMRYLHISKNKLTGDEDSIPEMRHGKMQVLIQPDIARYKDIN